MKQGNGDGDPFDVDECLNLYGNIEGFHRACIELEIGNRDRPPCKNYVPGTDPRLLTQKGGSFAMCYFHNHIGLRLGTDCELSHPTRALARYIQ